MTKKKKAEVKKRQEAKKESFFEKIPENFAGFFGVRPLSGRFLKAGMPSNIGELCSLVNTLANEKIVENCKAKEFVVNSIFRPCDAGAAGGSPQVDLVIVIDTSGSMSDEAANLSNVASEAINLAAQSCPSDLRVAWFGIEGAFPGTNFTTKLRDYLVGLGVADGDIKHRKVIDIGMDALEDGGRAIEDIAAHFDWRTNAKRVIFFLGDEPLEGGTPQDADDVKAADDAITTANSSQVTVFTYAGTGIENFEDAATGVKTVEEYERLATATGGIAYSHAGVNIENFKQVLVEIICKSSGAACGPARLPELRPCFTLRWGDGPRDNIETHDTEVLCLTASNPYTNVILKNVTAHILIFSATGQRPDILPDGTEAISIKPSFSICFGDLEPCCLNNQATPNQGICSSDGLSSISREVVLMSRNAKEGTYLILVAYCYDAFIPMAFGSVFPIELVKS